MSFLSIENLGGNFKNKGVQKRETAKTDLNQKITSKTNQHVGIFGFGPKKIVTEINDDCSKIEKQYDKNNNLMKEIVYKDVNGDGKEDIYSVTSYVQAKTEWDRNASSSTFIDKDGDGYDDVVIKKEYDKYGKLKTETKIIEEDINDVKSRHHLEYETFNRKMGTHKSGIYMY